MSWPRKREYLQAAIAAALAVIYATASTMDYQDALIAQASRFAPQAPVVTGQDASPESSPAALLSFPLDYKAVVCQAGRCVYYTGAKP